MRPPEPQKLYSQYDVAETNGGNGQHDVGCTHVPPFLSNVFSVFPPVARRGGKASATQGKRVRCSQQDSVDAWHTCTWLGASVQNLMEARWRPECAAPRGLDVEKRDDESRGAGRKQRFPNGQRRAGCAPASTQVRQVRQIGSWGQMALRDPAAWTSKTQASVLLQYFRNGKCLWSR